MQEITNPTDVDSLTILGHSAKPGKKLETFPNHHPERDYSVTLTTGEFTCLCPITEQPDFAEITIKYIPDKLILESKSLKLYLASYRSEGVFHEHATNTILDDLVKTMSPRWCKVSASFAVRGGIAITVDAEYQKAKPSSPPSPAPSDLVVEPQKKARSIPYERQGVEREDHKQPTAHWEREGNRSDGYPKRQVRDHRPGQGGNRPEREKRWATEKTNQPEREKRWVTDKTYQSEREKRSPVRQEPEYKRSERKTTKSLGETRTWRKRS